MINRGGGRVRRPVRRDVSEISPIIKYLLFGFNVIFWVCLILELYNLIKPIF